MGRMQLGHLVIFFYDTGELIFLHTAADVPLRNPPRGLSRGNLQLWPKGFLCGSARRGHALQNCNRTEHGRTSTVPEHTVLVPIENRE